MKSVQLKDKTFTLSIPAEQIQAEVKRVAEQMNKDLAAANPVFICVLNGAFMFAGDLMKHIKFPCEVTFVKLSSYDGVYSTGKVKEVLGLNENIEGRTIVVVEDIVDTGFTMTKILDSLQRFHPKEIKVASCLHKPDAMQVKLHLDYVAIQIPNDFIVGYGLDYDGLGRNLPEIYTLKNN